MKDALEELYSRNPCLEQCRAAVANAFNVLLFAFRSGGKVLVCGNGGSAADAEHICGELLKKFKRRRGVPAEVAAKLRPELAANLEGALPAISLVSMSGILTAFANDVSWTTAFAQQVLALAKPNDVLITLSTSGNSANCAAAAEVMKAVGGKTIAFTGKNASRLSEICDITIRVPETETYKVQELHLPVYHALCAAIEEEMFGELRVKSLKFVEDKCAISTGECEDGAIKILSREEFPTAGLSWQQVLDEFARRIEKLADNGHATCDDRHAVAAIGISCGGPLDSKRGVIMSPPNLPGWDNVPVVKFFEDRFHVPTAVQNDANACALAEYLYGSGRGAKNMVFMTFGTGLGAGIVIDGKLYSGANDNAGEIGHIRLAPTGPVGYNKEGSAEGFCSGAGIARLAKIRKGLDLTTKEMFARVRAGDPDCTEVFRESAEKLAAILAFTIDILNPEVIALGGVFMRNADLFMPIVDPILNREALPLARKVCRIVPAELGENIGDYAALAVAGDVGLKV